MESYKKLSEHLIEHGLKPRFLWCDFISPCQIKQKLEEFLPYTTINQESITDNVLSMSIDFHDFTLVVNFEFKATGDNIKCIQKITIE